MMLALMAEREQARTLFACKVTLILRNMELKIVQTYYKSAVSILKIVQRSARNAARLFCLYHLETNLQKSL